jgi:transposase
VIDWLKEASMTAVARNMGLTWDQVSGIQARAVARGLARREAVSPTRIGVDETSFQKRHEYVTIVTDLDGSRVLYVADGRGKDSLNGFFEQLDRKRLANIEVVAMDMHMPFILSAAAHVPNLGTKLCFDRFHVAQLFSRAVDEVRRSEAKRLAKEGDEILKRTRYVWLKSKKNLPRKVRRKLAVVLEKGTLVGDVWGIKEAAADLWHYKSRTWAEKAWLQLCKAALALEIPALTKAVDTVLRHLLGIINAIVHRATNAASESVNSRVQSLKRRANGYHSRARFRDAIMFHLGDLDLYPKSATPHETQ